MDLSDSIDALLEAVEVTCAEIENPEAAKAERKKLDVQTVEAPQEPADATESSEETEGAEDEPAAPEAAAAEDSTESENREPEPESETETEPDAVAQTGEALEALDAVEQNAQTLIEQSVDELLGETETQGDAEQGEPVAEQEEAPIEDSTELLESIADELTGEAGSPEQGESSDAQAQSTETAPPADESEQVDQGLTEGTDEQATTDVDIESTLSDLDASLASSGDELLMGDFETPDGEVISSDSLLDGDDASALLEQLGLDETQMQSDQPQAGAERAPEANEQSTAAHSSEPQVAAIDDSPAPQAAEAPQPTTVDAKAQLSENNQAPQHSPQRSKTQEQLDLIPESEAEVESIWQVARRVSSEYLSMGLAFVSTHAPPVAATVLLKINKPLKERPAQLRDSIGYLAIWSVLLATILWVYLVFIRVTPSPVPLQAPTRVLEPGEIVDPLRSPGSSTTSDSP